MTGLKMTKDAIRYDTTTQDVKKGTTNILETMKADTKKSGEQKARKQWHERVGPIFYFKDFSFKF